MGLQLRHLAERARDANGLTAEVDRHRARLRTDDATNSVRVVRDQVVARKLLDCRLGIGLEGATGEMTTPGPGCCCHCFQYAPRVAAQPTLWPGCSIRLVGCCPGFAAHRAGVGAHCGSRLGARSRPRPIQEVPMRRAVLVVAMCVSVGALTTPVARSGPGAFRALVVHPEQQTRCEPRP